MTDPTDPSTLPSDDQPQVPGPDPQPPAADDAPPPSRKRWVVGAMAALAITLFAVALLRGPEAGREGDVASTGSSGAPTEGSACANPEGQANLDFTLKDIKGGDVNLADYKGKVLLVNFWATWCGPCKVEIPEFVDVYDAYKDRGFEIIGVLAMDDPSEQQLQAFMSQYNMSYAVLRENEEFASANGQIWALPTSLIIDRSGTICTKHVGQLSRDQLEESIKGLL